MVAPPAGGATTASEHGSRGKNVSGFCTEGMVATCPKDEGRDRNDGVRIV